MMRAGIVCDDILEQSVRLASQQEGQVYDILATKSV